MGPLARRERERSAGRSSSSCRWPRSRSSWHYRRLQPRQYALKWGLPLVLGGALGNVFDRVRYGYVIDFIDYRADWIKTFNELIGKYYSRHVVTDHWPTFNVADIAICVGVALMAIDMLTSRRGKLPVAADVPIEPVLEPVPGRGGGAALSGDVVATLASESTASAGEGNLASASADDSCERSAEGLSLRRSRGERRCCREASAPRGRWIAFWAREARDPCRNRGQTAP